MENNDEIFLSIVIPMYNSEKYIKSCLESLKNQSVKDFEVIIPQPSKAQVLTGGKRRRSFALGKAGCGTMFSKRSR